MESNRNRLERKKKTLGEENPEFGWQTEKYYQQMVKSEEKAHINFLFYRMSGNNCLHRDAHNPGIKQEDACRCITKALLEQPWWMDTERHGGNRDMGFPLQSEAVWVDELMTGLVEYLWIRGAGVGDITVSVCHRSLSQHEEEGSYT